MNNLLNNLDAHILRRTMNCCGQSGNACTDCEEAWMLHEHIKTELSKDDILVDKTNNKLTAPCERVEGE